MSRSFTGNTTDKVTVSPAASINNLATRTLMAWVKIAAWVSSEDYGWFSRSGNTYCDVTSGPSATIYSGLDAATDGFSQDNADGLSIDVWAHIAITFDNGGDKKIHIFKNGVEIAVYAAQTAAAGALADDSAVDLLVGNYADSDTNTLNGLLYDFRVYNTVLSAPTIASIVAGGITTQPAGCVCQLTFASDAGATEPDASLNNNTGAITGATFDADSPFSSGVNKSVICIIEG